MGCAEESIHQGAKKVLKPPSGSQGSGAEISNWPHFQEMGFLDKFILSRRTTGNINELKGKQPSSSWDSFTEIITMNENEETVESMELENNDNENDSDQSEIMIDNQSQSQSSTAVENVKEPTDQQSPECSNRLARRIETGKLRTRMINKNVGIKKARVVLQDSITSALTDISKFLKTETETSGASQEDELFARSLAFSLSRIKNIKRKSACKIKLLEVIEEFDES